MSKTAIVRKNLNYTVDTFSLSQHTPKEKEQLFKDVSTEALKRALGTAGKLNGFSDVKDIIFPIHIPNTFDVSILKDIHMSAGVSSNPFPLLSLALGGLTSKFSVFSSKEIVDNIYSPKFIKEASMYHAPLLKGVNVRGFPMRKYDNRDENNDFLNETTLAGLDYVNHSRSRSQGAMWKKGKVEEKPKLKQLSSFNQLIDEDEIPTALTSNIEGVSIINLQLTIDELYMMAYGFLIALGGYRSRYFQDCYDEFKYNFESRKNNLYLSSLNETLSKVVKQINKGMKLRKEQQFGDEHLLKLIFSGKLSSNSQGYTPTTIKNTIKEVTAKVKERENPRIINVSFVIFMDNFKEFTKEYTDIVRENFSTTYEHSFFNSILDVGKLLNGGGYFDNNLNYGLTSEEKIFETDMSNYDVTFYPSSFSKVYLNLFLKELLTIKPENTMFSGTKAVKVSHLINSEVLNDQFSFILSDTAYNNLVENLSSNLYTLSSFNQIHNNVFTKTETMMAEPNFGFDHEFYISHFNYNFSCTSVIEALADGKVELDDIKVTLLRLLVGHEKETKIELLVKLRSFLLSKQQQYSKEVFTDKALYSLLSNMFILSMLYNLESNLYGMEGAKKYERVARVRKEDSPAFDQGALDLMEDFGYFEKGGGTSSYGNIPALNRAFKDLNEEEFIEFVTNMIEKHNKLVKTFALYLSVPTIVGNDNLEESFDTYVHKYTENNIKHSRIVHDVEKIMFLTNDAPSADQLGHLIFLQLTRSLGHWLTRARTFSAIRTTLKNQKSYPIKDFIYDLFVNYM